MMKLTVFSVALLVFGLKAHAQNSCPDSRAWRENVKVNTMTNSTGGCYLSVMPFNVKNLTYRDFLFDDNGLMMIFSSYGDGPESETTGAREFFIFPRVNKVPEASFLDNNDLVVTHPSGFEFLFSAKTGDVTAMTPGHLTVSSYFDPSLRSGVEIVSFPGALLLDVGFRMGSSPSSNRSGAAVFRDNFGASCTVKMTEIFRISADGDATLRHSTDASLSVFLKNRCPQLNVPF